MKQPAYEKLVAARKACHVCEARGLTNPASFPDLDSDRIGPYSRWQGNLDAELMVVAQDFADVDTFKRIGGWPGPRVRTNLALVDLLRAAGIDVTAPEVGKSEDRIFLTNAVLCLKRGGMGASISASCFRECGSRFLRPLIEVIRPRAIATLGVNSLRAVLRAFGVRTKVKLIELVEERTSFDLPNDSRIFPLFHPSRRVTVATRPMEEQRVDWAHVGEWLRTR